VLKNEIMAGEHRRHCHRSYPVLQAESKVVTSKQSHIHPGLPALVQRHLASEYLRPVPSHSQLAFHQLMSALEKTRRPLVLDSFCGTGHSTAALARRHPGHLVVGIDKSGHRLAKHPRESNDNYLLLRASCEDIWLQLLKEQLQPDYHYMLYPNPWPKSGHLKRRIHGGPAFRTLLQLGGYLELRSNWLIYVEEFGVAMHLAGHRGKVCELQPREPITLFERKYRDSGHSLWVYSGRVENSQDTP
jgi:tRNA (guanine-N7-)-methyltransferase